jgi:hypothetical protein
MSRRNTFSYHFGFGVSDGFLFFFEIYYDTPKLEMWTVHRGLLILLKGREREWREREGREREGRERERGERERGEREGGERGERERERGREGEHFVTFFYSQ